MSFIKNKKQNIDDYLKFFSTTRYNIAIFIDVIKNDDIGKYIVDVVNYFVNNNVGVLIITNRCDILNLFDIKVAVNTEYKNNVFNIFNNINRISFLCKKYKIDIINSYSMSISHIAYFVSKKNKIHFLNTFFEEPDISSRWKYFLSSVVKKSEKNICTSKKLCEFLINNFNIPTDRFYIDNYGIDIGEYKISNIKKGRVIDIATSINVDMNDKRILLYSCNFVSQFKEISFLISVLSKIKRDDFIVVLIGDFNNTKHYRAEIVKQIYEKKKKKKVVLMKQITDIQPLYLLSYATIYLSNKNEFMKKNIIESYLTKRPVIATNIGCLSNYIIDNNTGFLVRKNSFTETQNAIENMLDLTNVEYSRMCENGYKYAVNYFDFNKNIKTLDNMLYELVLKK